MSVRLSPCSACARHIKEGECVCPFCGAKAACTPQRAREEAAATPAAPTAFTAATRPADGPAPGRLSRSALFAAGAVGAAIASASCSSTSVTPLYGAVVPPEDAGVDSAATHDGAASDSGTTPDVSSVALYGAPPPEDAGDRG